MEHVKIDDLTNDERDLQPSKSQAEQIKNLIATPLNPTSDAGQKTLKKLSNLLFKDVKEGAVSDAISEAVDCLEMELEDAISTALDDTYYNFIFTVETEVLPRLHGLLEYYDFNLPNDTFGELDQSFLRNAGRLIGDFSATGAARELRSRMNENLSVELDDSVAWSINTDAIREVISEDIENFVNDTVIPVVTRNLCQTEAKLNSLT